jgi:DNA-binding NtrC family response regulator
MNPRIVAISGPLQGKAFEIDESNLIIGRGTSCDVRLDDPSVSARHCGMCWGGKQALIWDLGSKTGTFANGFSFPSQILVDGDRIRVGRSIFVYLEADPDEVDPAVLSLTSDEERWDRTEDGRERTAAYEAAKATVLEQFLNITASITGILDADQIQSQILELIFKVIPVERAAILLVGHDRDRVVSTMYRSIGLQNTDAFPLDQTLIDEALRQDAEIYREKTVCYPLAAAGTKVGLIYAAMPLAAAQYFTAGHKKLFASIAGLSAITLEHARYVTWLVGENQRLQEEIDIEHGMIGRSAKMQEVYRLVSKAGPLDLTVLITGESGTGKEMVAQALHRNSPRSKMPFHAVNCSAMTETLLGSELFGHEKGAFTGADVQRKGLFESADGGTIFLDEIGECSMKMQADLLRVIELGEFKRLGGKETIRVNVRLIAATHVDLEKAMKAGRFRPDLFFRLNVIRIHMPRLSDRREDIPHLAAFFIKKNGHLRRGSSPVQGIAAEAHSLLASYHWPGNVRELNHAIQRAIALGTSAYITPDDLPKDITARLGEPDEVGRWNQELNLSRKRILERALNEAGGNRQKAAQLLGLHPTYFAALCKELNANGRS